ncbi:MAG: thiamine diphosphokinase [Clostridium sp.]
MRVVIISGGTPPSKKRLMEFLKDNDYIIGADSGCNILKEYDIIPNLILGDFDSANKEAVDYLVSKGAECLKYPPEKDYTDTHLAYQIGKERGGTEFLFFGTTGSRIDHTLGNFGLLLIAQKENIKVTIIDNNNMTFLKEESFLISGNKGETISFHALSEEVSGFTIKGAKYNIENYTLKLLEPRAICNEFLNDDIEVTFNSGKLLIIYSFD